MMEERKKRKNEQIIPAGSMDVCVVCCTIKIKEKTKDSRDKETSIEKLQRESKRRDSENKKKKSWRNHVGFVVSKVTWKSFFFFQRPSVFIYQHNSTKAAY
jgi:hypothetical protein